MIVGCPKEIKNEEYRVGMTPNGAKDFVNAGHAAEEDAAAAVVLLEMSGAGLDGQLAGDLAHREEQRVSAARQLHRLEGDTADVGLEHALREILRIGRGQMQIRVQDLARLEQRPLLRKRLLDLVDHVCLGEHVFDVGELGAGRLVLFVAEARTDTCAGLDDHLVAGPHEVLGAVWRHGDAVLLVLDLLGDTDDHDSSSLSIPMITLSVRTLLKVHTMWQSSTRERPHKPRK